MTGADAPSALQQWFIDWEPRWNALAIRAALKLPQEPGLDKAVVTLETSAHVGSVTVWGRGTIEYIVLTVATKSEVAIWDKAYGTAAELRSLLDECADSFLMVAREGC